MGYDNPYMRSLYDHFKNIFKRQECGKFITGDPKDIKSISLEDIENVFNTYYHPENCFLVITGNFNPYEMLDAIKENQKKKDFGKYLNPVRIKSSEPKKIIKDYDEFEAGVKNYKIRVAVKVPLQDLKNLDNYKILLYTRMILKINFGSCSHFKNELLDKELIYDMNYTVNKMDEFLILSVIANTSYKDEILDRIYDKFDNLELNEKDFNRSLNALIATTILDYEDIEIVNDDLQGELIYQGKIYFNKKEIIESIKYDDVVDTMKKINFKNRSTMVVVPIKE